MNAKFLEPENLSEAISLLIHYGDEARIIAGGTSVVLMLRQRLIAPAILVSLGRVAEQDFIRSEADGLHLGAMTHLRELESSPLVRRFCPALAHAFSAVGNVRVRHQATLGGNLCAADYAADPPSILTALDARLRVQGPGTSREIPLSEFFLGFYTTVLKPTEVVTEVFVPRLPPSARAVYHRYTSVSAEGRPCVAVGVIADFNPDRTCRDLRIVVGAAVETPQRVAEAEAWARGQPLTDDLIAAIAEEYVRALDPLTDARGSAWYRREMIREFVKRATREVRDGHR